MTDAIAYMDWKRVVPWKVLSLMARPDEPPIPIGYGARNRDFPDHLKPGSRIWVVTRIANEFSLAGRVTVRDMLDRNRLAEEKWPKDLAGLFVRWSFVARADPAKSEFFETNNAEAAVTRHKIRFAQNRTIVYRDASLAKSFAPCMVQARKTVFLSYRWKEGRRFAMALAREFRRRGFSPWLDALSIPRYRASREPGVTASRLKRLVKLGIEASTFAVVINTKTYAEKYWTKMELGHIRAAGIPWFQVMRSGRMRKCVEPPIMSRKSEEAVQEILKRRKQR
jgi:hypothetical protein